MATHKSHSEATNTHNTIFDVYSNTMKLFDVISSHGIYYSTVWSALGDLQPSQEYYTKYHLPKIIRKKNHHFSDGKKITLNTPIYKKDNSLW